MGIEEWGSGTGDRILSVGYRAIIKYNEETPIVTLYSADVVQNEDGTDNINNNLYPIEFLNSVNVNGLPLHKLELKDGALVMLLRNLDVEAGLWNGTTLKVLNISSKVLKVQITNGSHTGDIALIPRINLTPTDTNFPFKISRRQFPVRLCFAMTINKAQGQSINNLGIYLPSPVFGHGQLYVALSRAGMPQKTKVVICDIKDIQGSFVDNEGKYTTNVVYTEVL